MKVYTNFISEQIEAEVKNDIQLIDKPITLFYDYVTNDINQLKENPYNILFIQEPNQLFGFHNWTLQYGHYFDCIFTWSQPILDSYPNNSVFFPFAAYHKDILNLGYQNIDKNFEVSFMCGPKNMIEGHNLRHRVFESQSKIKIPTKFYYKGDYETVKMKCWESMYHIAAENSKNRGYYTEKIMDAFLTKTLPIYWGCTNITDFFDERGMILYENETELVEIVNNLTPEFYYSKIEYIENNFQLANQYGHLLERMNAAVKEFCKVNNI